MYLSLVFMLLFVPKVNIFSVRTCNPKRDRLRNSISSRKPFKCQVIPLFKASFDLSILQKGRFRGNEMNALSISCECCQSIVRWHLFLGSIAYLEFCTTVDPVVIIEQPQRQRLNSTSRFLRFQLFEHWLIVSVMSGM